MCGFKCRLEYIWITYFLLLWLSSSLSSLSCPSLSFPPLTFSNFISLSLWVNRQGCDGSSCPVLTSFSSGAATPTLMTLQWRQTSCTLTYDCAPCIICVWRDRRGGSGEIPVQAVNRKRELKRHGTWKVGVSHRSCGNTARLEVLLVFLGCAVWQESGKQVKETECPQSFNLQDCFNDYISRGFF